MKTVLKSFLIIVVSLTTSLCSVNKIAAQTTSLTTAGTASSVAVSGTSSPIAWSNATIAMLSSDDNSFATVSLNNDQTSQFLNVSNFNFSIPANAIITGVLVELRRVQNYTSNTSISDNNVQLINNSGVLIGTNQKNASEWSATEESVTYGGNSNTWGLSNLTPAIVNSSGFGFSLRAQCGTNSRTGSIDQIQMSVTYVIPKYFKSKQNGNFNSASTWSESSDGASWIDATTTPSVNDLTVSIENTHTVTISTDVTSDQVTIQTGGSVNISDGQTWTINNGDGNDLVVNGNVNNNGTLASNSSGLEFNTGSIYTHLRNGGNIPSAAWNDNSLCTITGIIDSDPGGLSGQTFYNLTYNSAGQTGDENIDQSFTVLNNFKIISTGTGSLMLVDDNTSRTISTKNFEMADGEFNLTNEDGNGTLNVSGNFSHIAGIITESANVSDAGSGFIIFSGTTSQVFKSGGTVSNGINYTVNSGAILQMFSASTVVNGNSFTLNSGGTLDIKSADGITTSGTTGNIQTTTRTYNSTANYIYSGASQTVGNGLTGAKSLTLSGDGTKTFSTANFTAVSSSSLPVTVDLSIGSGVVMQIPNTKIIEVSSKLYIAGIGKNLGKYGSTTSLATYKDNTYFTATTGIVNAAASALPVTLSSFTAKPTTDNKVSLAWVTSTEQVNKGFRIERQAGSTTGKYEQIGFVGSKAKDGNSQNTLTYNFIDAAPKVGAASFYRLVQEDLDGKLTFTEVRVVKLNGQSVSTVFPNPSNGAVNISRTSDGKKMNIQVIDQSGRIISQVNNITDANYRINISQSGIYSIKMTYPATGEQSVQRVIIQK